MSERYMCVCMLVGAHSADIFILIVTCHSVVENSIWHWLPGCVLGVQGLAHHMNVGLLPHLTGREHAKLKIATAKRS